MKTKLTLIIIAFTISNAFAQTDSLKIEKSIETLNQKVVLLESSYQKLQNANSTFLTKQKFEELNEQIETITSKTQKALQENNELSSQYKKVNRELSEYKRSTAKEIDSLQQIIRANTANIQTTANELGVKIEDTHEYANQSIYNLNESLSQTTLYWIIVSVILAVLLLVVFLILRKQIFKQKSDLVTDIQNTRKNLEEEGVKLDNKLIEVFESQLKIVNSNKSQTASPNETDHTLALKVADEIIRIQKNLTRMDEKTKGLKQLSASVKRIQDNFASNGYELVEMLKHPYDEGMKASVTFVPDENLEIGQQIISRIIKPQVNYQGVMIQTAQIEVSQGE